MEVRDPLNRIRDGEVRCVVAEWIIRTLTDAGRQDDPEGAIAVGKLESIREHDCINRLHWRHWECVTGHLPTDDLVALLKALVVAERRFRWLGGSVAAAIFVFAELERRDRTASREVADWILSRTENVWLPFGRMNLGARSVTEYELSQTVLAEQKKAHALLAQEQKEAAMRLRDERTRLANERALNQQETNATRRVHIAELAALDPASRLHRIAKDQEHGILYYPPAFALVEDEVIEALDTDTQIALAERLGGRRKGPWRKMYELLTRHLHVAESSRLGKQRGT